MKKNIYIYIFNIHLNHGAELTPSIKNWKYIIKDIQYHAAFAIYFGSVLLIFTIFKS